MDKKQALKIRIGETLLERAERKEGTFNRADPTAYVNYTWRKERGRLPQVEVTLQRVYEGIARVYVGGRRVAFISSAINKRLHPIVAFLGDCISDAENKDLIAMYEAEKAFGPCPECGYGWALHGRGGTCPDPDELDPYACPYCGGKGAFLGWEPTGPDSWVEGRRCQGDCGWVYEIHQHNDNFPTPEEMSKADVAYDLEMGNECPYGPTDGENWRYYDVPGCAQDVGDRHDE